MKNGNRDLPSSVWLFGSSRFPVNEYLSQKHSVATPQLKVEKAGFSAEAQSAVCMVRQAHHERKKTAHPERVEGLRDLSASAVQNPSPLFSTLFSTGDN
jgi:hypothetical protein